MASAPALSAAHELQLQQLLRFARAKRVQHVKECVRHVEDLASGRVQRGDVYSGAEVADMLAELRASLERQVDEEVANAYHSSALMLQLALQQAQAAGAAISVDTSALEDSRLLAAIAAAEAAAAARPAADFARKAGALGALGGGAAAGGRAAINGGGGHEAEQLRSEVEALRSRLQALQVGATAAMREKCELARRLEAADAAARAAAAEIEAARAGAAAAAAGGAAEAEAQAALERRAAEAADEARRALEVAEASQRELAAMRQQLRSASGQAAALEAAAGEKLQGSKQFKQLQQLMAEKSQQVIALRQRLAKYEPEEVAAAE